MRGKIGKSGGLGEAVRWACVIRRDEVLGWVVPEGSGLSLRFSIDHIQYCIDSSLVYIILYCELDVKLILVLVTDIDTDTQGAEDGLTTNTQGTSTQGTSTQSTSLHEFALIILLPQRGTEGTERKGVKEINHGFLRHGLTRD